MGTDRSEQRHQAGLDSPRRALIVAAVTTAAVTALSNVDRVIPATKPYVGTLVGAAFLVITWRLVLRRDTAVVRAYGLSLGGLTEQEPLDARRLLVEGARAVGWALLLAVVIFPPFWCGYRMYWGVESSFVFRLPDQWWDLMLGQLLVVALPEAAFYRGYLQTALDRGWGRSRRRILGAELGLGWLATSAIFAVGHYLALPHPNRLAVFFPALVFGWLCARTKGIGAALVFHALCNLLVDVLTAGYVR